MEKIERGRKGDRVLYPGVDRTSNLPSANVLLACNDNDTCGYLAEILHLDGYDIVETHSGEGLMTNLHLPLMGAGWRLIIAAASLPLISGLDILRQMRQRRDMTPFVLLIEKDDHQSRLEGKALGVSVFLSQPYNPEEVRKTIREMIGS